MDKTVSTTLILETSAFPHRSITKPAGIFTQLQIIDSIELVGITCPNTLLKSPLFLTCENARKMNSKYYRQTNGDHVPYFAFVQPTQMTYTNDTISASFVTINDVFEQSVRMVSPKCLTKFIVKSTIHQNSFEIDLGQNVPILKFGTGVTVLTGAPHIVELDPCAISTIIFENQASTFIMNGILKTGRVAENTLSPEDVFTISTNKDSITFNPIIGCVSNDFSYNVGFSNTQGVVFTIIFKYASSVPLVRVDIKTLGALTYSTIIESSLLGYSVKDCYESFSFEDVDVRLKNLTASLLDIDLTMVYEEVQTMFLKEADLGHNKPYADNLALSSLNNLSFRLSGGRSVGSSVENDLTRMYLEFRINGRL